MFIAQAVNFTFVALAIWFFGFKKILSTIKEREKQISDSLKNADLIKLELEESRQKQEATLSEASQEAKKTVSLHKSKQSHFLKLKRRKHDRKPKLLFQKLKLPWSWKGKMF